MMETFLPDAIAYYQSGNFMEAERLCREILDGCPGQADAMHLLGLALSGSGHPDEGTAWVRKAVTHRPQNADLRFSLGNLFHAQGRDEEAINCFERTIALKPGHADAHYNLGNLMLSQGKLQRAIDCFKETIRLSPESVGGWHNLGVALSAFEYPGEAMACFQHAVALKPDSAVTFNSMGTLMEKAGDLEAAKGFFKKALVLKADDAAVWSNLGNIHLACHEIDAALACFQKALALQPDLAEACFNIGNLYQESGEAQKALGAYERALALKADYPDAVAQLYYQARQACDWPLARQWEHRLEADTKESLHRGIRPAEMPFMSIVRQMDARRNTAVAGAWARTVSGRMKDSREAVAAVPKPDKNGVITIGYLSGDFRNHPVALLAAGMLACHDRRRFRVFGYAYGPADRCDGREKIVAACDRFEDFGSMSDRDAARRIAKDGVDILVDLTGHTRGNRIGILARRPAPVQVSYLGFLGSSGADFIDYIITDRLATPPDQAAFYSEKFVYLPDSFMVTDDRQLTSKKGFSREAFDLPEDGLVFCSFNNPYKVDPAVFDCWMRILRRVPGSVLWLFAKNALTSENLKKEARHRGVSPERLVFAEKMPLAEHLARLKLADLALDTWCYNGGATTVNALWAGVPVITLVGRHFVSRMTASSLVAVGLKDLVAESPEAYEQLAVHLALHTGELRAHREALARNRLSAPLFDTLRFSRHLEQAYRMMWEKSIAGEAPGQIIVRQAAG